MFRNLLQSPALVLKFIVSILYTFMGVYLIVDQDLIDALSGPLAVITGAVLILYGLFRFYRAWIELKEISSDEEE